MEHRELARDARIVLGGLRRALEVLDRALAVSVEELESHEPDERIVVVRVRLKDLLVRCARPLGVAVARVEGRHHVEEARAALGRHEVDRAADLVERLAGASGLRPCVAEAHEYLGAPDVSVDVRELPEDIAAVLVFDDRLEGLLDLALPLGGPGVARARHLELVEERADVVLVDVSEDELVERERIVVPPLVLEVHRAVVRDEARVLAQPEAH